MQILSAEQIRAWDAYTMQHEPVASVDLMERAAMACCQWLQQKGYEGHFTIFCGKGNNGGDGLAIARLLAVSGHEVAVYILEFGHKGTDDFQQNLARLHNTPVTIRFVSTEDTLHTIEPGSIVIDALLGSGLNRAVEGLTARVVQHINDSHHTVIAIDIPSGLSADRSSKDQPAVKASHTLSFQCYKPAFLVAENAAYTGEVHILDIQLQPGFLNQLQPRFRFIEPSLVRFLVPPRHKFAHKGTYGHAALIAGSKGMMGAAVLAARACLHSGVGKLTCHIPAQGVNIVQVAAPEAMCKMAGQEDHVQEIDSLNGYNAIGIGPGLGQQVQAGLLQQVITQSTAPLVIDADALNLLSRHPDLLSQLPPHTILTPHVKEFERLFGACANDFERIERALAQAAALQVIIVLKGAYTLVATPAGAGYFNPTGNPGMATGGSGDVLTGMLTALHAQGLPGEQAALTGVYLHGLAGDLAVQQTSLHGMTASDLITHIGAAYRKLLA